MGGKIRRGESRRESGERREEQGERLTLPGVPSAYAKEDCFALVAVLRWARPAFRLPTNLPPCSSAGASLPPEAPHVRISLVAIAASLLSIAVPVLAQSDDEESTPAFA